MAVEDFVEGLLAGAGVVDPMDVFVRVGVVVVVPEGQVAAGYPGDVEKGIAADLEYAPGSDVASLKEIVNLQVDVSLAKYQPPQGPTVGFIAVKVKGGLPDVGQEGVLL